MTDRDEGRVRVWYRCQACKLTRQGDDGTMFCDECGGPLRSVGYKHRAGDFGIERPKERKRGRRF